MWGTRITVLKIKLHKIAHTLDVQMTLRTLGFECGKTHKDERWPRTWYKVCRNRGDAQALGYLVNQRIKDKVNRLRTYIYGNAFCAQIFDKRHYKWW